MARPATLIWQGGVEGTLDILDQRLLPGQCVVRKLSSAEDAWDAIKTLAVRGAPAIGVAAAYGMVLAARGMEATTPADFLAKLEERGDYLKSSRPTAVNLEWAVERMLRAVRGKAALGIGLLRERLLAEARAIMEEDLAMCSAIGRNGARFITPGSGVLTHCNAGNLATSERDGLGGTALAIMYEAQRQGVHFRVFSDETRPLLQGSRLTAWELSQAGIDVTIICDSMAALVMRQKKVHLAIVGADRIAANGDTANKIGTYSVATLAAAHGIPFIVAAPSSTFDLAMADGQAIPIEERDPKEITQGFGKLTGPDGVKAYNPAFDVTPARLIHAIVTERGVISPVTRANIAAHLKS